MAALTAAGVIGHLDQQLEYQRDANAAGYAREAALVELRSLAIEAAIARNLTDLTPDQLWQWPETPEQRARLRSLVDRAIQPHTTAQEAHA